MRWPETMKATALAALAERTATAAAAPIDTQRIWDANEVWLSRIQRPGSFAAPIRAALSGRPAIAPRQDMALHD